MSRAPTLLIRIRYAIAAGVYAARADDHFPFELHVGAAAFPVERRRFGLAILQAFKGNRGDIRGQIIVGWRTGTPNRTDHVSQQLRTAHIRCVLNVGGFFLVDRCGHIVRITRRKLDCRIFLGIQQQRAAERNVAHRGHGRNHAVAAFAHHCLTVAIRIFSGQLADELFADCKHRPVAAGRR